VKLRWAFALLAAVASGIASAATPPVDRVGFDPGIRTRLPLEAAFLDEDGRSVRLGDYFHGQPVIVVPGYYGCSNLCSVVLHGLAAALAMARLDASRDVEVVVVSIDPLDTPSLARTRKRTVLDRDPYASGWHFLTGREGSIDAVMHTLGYRYAYDESAQQYAHAAGLAIATPEGTMARALYGVAFDPSELAAAVRDATVDKPGDASTAARWLLCFRDDPHTGRYGPVAMNAVRAAALCTLVVLGLFLVWLRKRRSG
jgi:protein SCO1